MSHRELLEHSVHKRVVTSERVHSIQEHDVTDVMSTEMGVVAGVRLRTPKETSPLANWGLTVNGPTNARLWVRYGRRPNRMGEALSLCDFVDGALGSIRRLEQAWTSGLAIHLAVLLRHR